MVDFPLDITALSLTQGWLGGCLVAAIWCGLRARKQGYSFPLYASVGLLLGLGAVPLTWLATLEELTDSVAGTGLNRLEIQEEPERAARQKARLAHGLRQLEIGLIFGVAGGFVANFTQALTHLLPATFQQTAEEYRAGLNPWAGMEMKIRFLWSVTMLVSPTLLYLLFNRLGWPGRLRENRAAFVHKVIHWPAWVLPAALLLFFAFTGITTALGFQAYVRYLKA